MMNWRLAVVFSLAFLGVSPEAYGESEAQIEKIQMGQYWYGAEISKKDLLGKVVVLEIWGKN